jgi:hypothetical protein
MITEELYKEISGKSAVFWMCKGCRDIMRNARFKNCMASMNEATIELNDTYQKIVEELKSEIKETLLSEIRQEIQGGFNKLSPAVHSPLPPRVFKFGSINTPKRSRDDEARASDQPAKILRGTGPPTAGIPLAPTDRPADKFWVYLTKISPDVSEADVEKLVKECLHTDEVVAKSLIPKGRPRSTLSFVSFKVGVNFVLKPKAMDPLSWPQGIEFREFIDDSTRPQNFWRPQQNADAGPVIEA